MGRGAGGKDNCEKAKALSWRGALSETSHVQAGPGELPGPSALTCPFG
jgi:hypothetical protein